MTPLCLDHLSLVDLTALELIEVAARLGYARVSLFVGTLPLSPALDLGADSAARAAVARALAAHGLSCGIIEPFMLTNNVDWDQARRFAAIAAEFGGFVNALGFDHEPARLTESLARLAQIAGEAGAPMVIEAFPLSRIRTQAEALAHAERLGPDVGLCVDTLHVIRSGGSWADVAALPPARIRHVQVSDGTAEPPEDRFHEAVAGRLPPGEGAFNLAALLPVLPASAILAVEAPFQAPPGLTPLQRGEIQLRAMRRLLGEAA